MAGASRRRGRRRPIANQPRRSRCRCPAWVSAPTPSAAAMIAIPGADQRLGPGPGRASAAPPGPLRGVGAACRAPCPRHAADQRQHPHAAAERVAPADVQEVLRHREHDAEQRERDQRGQDRAPGEPGRAEQRAGRPAAGRRPRRPGAPTSHEHRQRHGPGRHGGHGGRVGPAVLPGPDDPVGQRGQPGAGDQDARQVQARPALGPRLRHQHRSPR